MQSSYIIIIHVLKFRLWHKTIAFYDTTIIHVDNVFKIIMHNK